MKKKKKAKAINEENIENVNIEAIVSNNQILI